MKCYRRILTKDCHSVTGFKRTPVASRGRIDWCGKGEARLEAGRPVESFVVVKARTYSLDLGDGGSVGSGPLGSRYPTELDIEELYQGNTCE